MNEPIGDICVIKDDERPVWTVTICRGNGTRDQLKVFQTREEAAEFALAERDRFRKHRSVELMVHFPDDCPCHCETAKGWAK
ncbi:MAG: hypothetical protein AMXMBFR13_19330 [Phycisphaerae bacterium]